MSLAAIRTALETRLAAMLPILQTAWENTAFTPTQGTPYQRVFLLPAQPDNPTFGPGLYVEQGILQINLCYPLQTGPKDALARAMAIRAQFPRGLSLTSSGIVTIVEKTTEIGGGDNDDVCYQLPVRVRWYANVTT